jgi:hypothetical protein
VCRFAKGICGSADSKEPECPDVESAIAYLIEEETSYRLREDGEHREAFEVQVRFNTGARIEATFPKRAEAIAFLRGFA